MAGEEGWDTVVSFCEANKTSAVKTGDGHWRMGTSGGSFIAAVEIAA